MGVHVAVNLAAITGAFDGLTAPGSLLIPVVVAAPAIGHLRVSLV